MVVDLGPVPLAPGLNQIENISHQIEKFRFRFEQELEEFFALQVSGAQMEIGNPDCPEVKFRHGVLLRIVPFVVCRRPVPE
jgi:hypothetical protein